MRFDEHGTILKNIKIFLVFDWCCSMKEQIKCAWIIESTKVTFRAVADVLVQSEAAFTVKCSVKLPKARKQAASRVVLSEYKLHPKLPGGRERK